MAPHSVTELIPPPITVGKPLRTDILPKSVGGEFAFPLNGEFFAEVVTTPEEVTAHLPAWAELSERACVRNIFYEASVLLPAWKAFAEREPLHIVLIFGTSKRPDQPPALCGLFPMRVRSSASPLKPNRLESFTHDHCSLTVPLVRRGQERSTLACFFQFVREHDSFPGLVEFSHWPEEGTLSQTLLDLERDEDIHASIVDRINRALLVIPDDAESYLADSLSNSRRQELRRQRRRLLERGSVMLREMTAGDDANEWVRWFLQLEESGWKGEENSAMARHRTLSEYFRAIVQRLHTTGQVMMCGLFLDDEPIALKCNFFSGPDAFAFKIAYDETFAKLSPGVQLELENIEALAGHRHLRRMDSCAVARHPMIDVLWRERRTIGRLLVSTGRRVSNLQLGLQRIRHAFD